MKKEFLGISVANKRQRVFRYTTDEGNVYWGLEDINENVLTTFRDIYEFRHWIHQTGFNWNGVKRAS